MGQGDWATTVQPLYNAIVWTDTRTQGLVRKLKARLGSDKLQDLCGLPLSTYPSVAKLLWLLENELKVSEAYEKGTLCFGTIDSWLVYRLNGGPRKNVFVTDPTNASRTMFMNIHTLEYDDSLIDFFRLDPSKLNLPSIIKSTHAKGYGSIATGPLKGMPITGCLGDQSAALVGQKAYTPGMAKNTYGTGCFLLYNVGEKPVISKHGLLATVAYEFEGGTPMYALEGSIAVAGSSVQFLVNNLGFVDSSEKISQLAATVEDSGGCTFVTAFSGLFAPYWIDDARGSICKDTQTQPPSPSPKLSATFRAGFRAITSTDKKFRPDIMLKLFPSRHNAIHPTRPHRPRNPRSNLFPNQSHPRRHGKGQRPHPKRTSRRRRDE